MTSVTTVSLKQQSQYIKQQLSKKVNDTCTHLLLICYSFVLIYTHLYSVSMMTKYSADEKSTVHWI